MWLKLTGISARTAWVFMVLALAAGLYMVFVTGPFQTPDEHAHFFRASQIAGGELFAVRVGKKVGGWMPDEGKPTGPAVWIAIACLRMFISMSKLVYVPLAALVLIIPSSKFGSRRPLGVILTLYSAAVLFTTCSTLYGRYYG
jgi:uncharacterized membrane protein